MEDMSPYQEAGYRRGQASEGQVTLGWGAYLPSRKLCCSEGLASLLKRTEAPTRHTFLLPEPQQPLPGGGGSSTADRLRVTTYQADQRGQDSLTSLQSGSPRPGDVPSRPWAFGSNLPPSADGGSAELKIFSASTEEPFISLMWINTTSCSGSTRRSAQTRRRVEVGDEVGMVCILKVF